MLVLQSFLIGGGNSICPWWGQSRLSWWWTNLSVVVAAQQQLGRRSDLSHVVTFQVIFSAGVVDAVRLVGIMDLIVWAHR